MNNRIEILAPAGGMDSIYAAVRSGADAVYIGGKSFSARASAHNFDADEMRQAVRCCHQRGVKVYLALNTIIFDDEMDDALALVRAAARADIDAVIIQDIGLATLIKEMIPGLPLHASTQMTVHTPCGARALYELGFKRAVLSRELSLGEIREIHDFCPDIELEVFVHGALCMCVSGQCYFSAMLGGRSANRGMCAQPCRLPMRCGENDHALSLKDNGSLGYIRELERIGVTSAKIEGRMKRPEYVAAATAAAKEARDNGSVSEASRKRLEAVFSRTGFTDGYLSGRIGQEMFGHRRKEDVTAADSALLREIRTGYKDEIQKVPLDMALCVRVGEKPQLTVSDGAHAVIVEGAAPAEQAIHLPLDGGRAAQNLTKTGGTPYYINRLSTEIGEGVSLPASALNALRRSALTELDERRAAWHDYEIKDIQTEDFIADGAKFAENRVCVTSADYPRETEELGRVYVDLESIDMVTACGGNTAIPQSPRGDSSLYQREPMGIEAPRVTFGNEAQVYARLKALKDRGAQHLIAHNIASAYMGRQLGYTVHAGFGMNLANSYALKWARDYGIVDAELSPEIDLKRVETLHKAIPVGIIGYGHLPLMITRNAPAGKDLSCKTESFLQDRKNERFPVIRRGGCYEILNCVPILMPQEDYPLAEGVFLIYRFTVENSVEKMKKPLEKLRENHGFERITHGLYLRGVKKLTI